MKRASLLFAAIFLCFIVFVLGTEERSLATRVEHFFMVSGQAQEPAHPLLGHGLGVDHVGIVVRDLEKTINDYEQVLGFKNFKAPPFTDGTIRSFVFF